LRCTVFFPLPIMDFLSFLIASFNAMLVSQWFGHQLRNSMQPVATRDVQCKSSS
jgi:hypothetical protein